MVVFHLFRVQVGAIGFLVTAAFAFAAVAVKVSLLILRDWLIGQSDAVVVDSTVCGNFTHVISQGDVLEDGVEALALDDIARRLGREWENEENRWKRLNQESTPSQVCHELQG